MLFDVSRGAGCTMQSVYPELAAISTFAADKNVAFHEELLKFTFLLVDINSPFQDSKKDFPTRAREVAYHLGIDKKIVWLNTWINGRYVNTYDAVVLDNMVVTFLKLVDNYAYTVWYAMYRNFNEDIRFLSTDLDPADDFFEAKKARKAAIRKELKNTSRELDEYAQEVFGARETKAIAARTAVRMETWPERMAKMYNIERGEI